MTILRRHNPMDAIQKLRHVSNCSRFYLVTATRSYCGCEFHCRSVPNHACSFHRSCFPVRSFLGWQDWFLDSSDQDVQGFCKPDIDTHYRQCDQKVILAYKDKNASVVGVVGGSMFVLPFIVMLGWAMNINFMTLQNLLVSVWVNCNRILRLKGAL